MRTIFITTIFIICFYSCKKDQDAEVIVPKADFSYGITLDTTGEVQFKNLSINATSYLWDFGNGKISVESEPEVKFGKSFDVIVKLIAYRGNYSDTCLKEVTDQIILYKPNIYIYPKKNIQLSLKISFPSGGSIIESIPAYNNGWNVYVDTNGIIDNKYRFLFYESKQPDLFQNEVGWCISKYNLKSFFEQNLAFYNFSENEIIDFLVYWLPRLNEYDYYLIYPQTNIVIDKIIKLDFSIELDNINRLYYGFSGLNNYIKIEKPLIKGFEREGNYIMEWGGYFK
jgi:hypothetical protein